MSSFKQFFSENKSENFKIKKSNKKWTFTQESSGKRFFVKIDERDIYDSMGKFLRALEAKSACKHTGKLNDYGSVDHMNFVSDIVKGERSTVRVKPNMIEKIKSTWALPD